MTRARRVDDEASGGIGAGLVVLVALKHEQMIVADVLVLGDAGAGLVAQQHGASAAVRLLVKPMGGHPGTKRLPSRLSKASTNARRLRMTREAGSLIILSVSRAVMRNARRNIGL